MHIKVVFSDTHLLKVSYFLFKILNLICNAIFNITFKMCQLCSWRFSKLFLKYDIELYLQQWSIIVSIMLLKILKTYIRNMTLKFICNIGFLLCQLCCWRFSKLYKKYDIELYLQHRFLDTMSIMFLNAFKVCMVLYDYCSWNGAFGKQV